MKEINPIAFLAAILGIIGGFAVGYIAASVNHKSDAIQAGVAEYRVNPKTGETSFHFITKETSK
jgi:hypothetical protein